MNAEVATGPLTARQLADFRALLKRRYLELWREVVGEVESADLERFQDTAGETHDLEDQGAADVVVDVNLAAIHRDIAEMRDIQAALGRIAWDKYGICSDCHGEIAFERLHAYPTAKRCHECQQRHERAFAREPTPSL